MGIHDVVTNSHSLYHSNAFFMVCTDRRSTRRGSFFVIHVYAENPNVLIEPVTCSNLLNCCGAAAQLKTMEFHDARFTAAKLSDFNHFLPRWSPLVNPEFEESNVALYRPSKLERTSSAEFCPRSKPSSR